MEKVSVSDSKRRKLDKKKKKQQDKRRKRINARIDRTIVFLVILIYLTFSLMEAKECLDRAGQGKTLV